MSKSNNKSLLAAVEARGFGGIGAARESARALCTADMYNFRLLSDGSLQKRGGYAPMMRAPAAVRAIWTGALGDGFGGYLLSGSQVMRMDMEQRTLSEIGTVGTREGEASLFWYTDRLFLLDGQDIYEIWEDRLRRAQGFVPLYGDGWHSGKVGEICQPLNLLTRRARIRYRLESDPTLYLCTGHQIDSLDGIFINGVQKNPSDYTINEAYRTVNVPGLVEGDEVELFVTFAGSLPDATALKSSLRGTVYGGIANSRVFLWGGKRGNVMYTSGTVLRRDYERVLKIYPEADALYLPEGNDFVVGDGRYDITALGRHYDRLLIFTEGQTWMANSELWETETFPLMRINSAVGCTARDGVAMCGNDPVCISGKSVFRFTSETDATDECNAYPVSTPIRAYLSDAHAIEGRMLADPYSRQIWLYRPSDESGEVLLYGMDTGQWSRYKGLCADCFFLTEQGVGFVRGQQIYELTTDRVRDLEADGEEHTVTACWTAKPTDFGLGRAEKRLLGVELEGWLCEAPVRLSYVSNTAVAGDCALSVKESIEPARLHRRLRSGRFERLIPMLHAEEAVPQRIAALRLEVKQ